MIIQKAIIGSTLFLLLIGNATAQVPATPINAARLKLTPQVTLQNLRALPPDAIVETSKGRVVSAQRFLAVADAIRAAHNKPRQAAPSGFSRTQAQPTLIVGPGTHWPSLLTRSETDVVQLPNGTKLTIGDIKKLATAAPQMRGQALVQPTRSDLLGTAIPIKSAADLSKLKNASDSTILENKNGVRVTLGDLRAEARKQQQRK